MEASLCKTAEINSKKKLFPEISQQNDFLTYFTAPGVKAFVAPNFGV